MPTPTQANRKIAINTPLGTDVLVVRRCSIREELSRLFEIELDLISSRNDINFDEIIGKNVTLRLEGARGKTRYFNGIVNRFTQGKSERSYSVYRATVVPWLWFLTRSSDCRIFQESMEVSPDEMTVPGIIKKVFKDHGFEDFRDDGLSSPYRTWDFCVQYRESAFNFVSRLMELEGISYFFEHTNGKHTLVLADSMNANMAFPEYASVPYHPHTQGGTEREAVTDWVVQKEVQSGSFALNDFNFENARLAQQQGLVVSSEINRTHDLSSFEAYDYPGTHLTSGDGDTLARLRIEELQARHEVLRGQGNVRGLSAGYKFSLQSHPRSDQNREYLVTKVEYQIDAGEFESGTALLAGAPPAPGAAGGGGTKFLTCSFDAIPASQPFRPPRTTPKPEIRGPQTAMVVGPSGDEIHTDQYGRVKVQFHWDRYGKADENASCWIRVSQAAAGKGWGSVSLPRVGHEVVVEFLEGDPDRPLITGQLYNSGAMPPYGLPDASTMTTFKSNSSKGGEGFNEIRVEDKKGEEQLFIHGERNQDIRIKNDAFEWIGNERHLTVVKNQIESIKEDRSETVDGAHKEKIGKDRHLKVVGKQAVEIGDKYSLTVKADMVEVFKANHSEETADNYYLKASGIVIEGSNGITLKCGGNSVVINSSGTTIKGNVVTVDGSMVKIASGPGASAASGSAGSADAPEEPAAAHEADTANPGEVAEAKATQRKTRTGKYGSVPVAALPPPGASSAAAAAQTQPQEEPMEFQLLDAAGEAVAGEPYTLKYGSGKEESGKLDGEGKVRKNVPAGETVSITFPERGDDEWDMHRTEDS